MTQDTLVPILFAGGVDTKTDAKSVAINKLLTLENGVFENPGKIRKRNGYTSLGASIVSGGTITNPVNISSDLAKNTLLVTTQDFAYLYSNVAQQFAESGKIYDILAKASVEIDGYELLNSTAADMCVIGNYEIYSYQIREASSAGVPISQQRLGVQFTIKDRRTKAVLYESAFSSVNPFLKTKIVTDGTFAYQAKIQEGNASLTNPTNIEITKIDPTLYGSNPVVGTVTINRNLSAAGDNWFDFICTGSHLYIGYLFGTPGGSRITRLDLNLTVLNTYTIPSGAFLFGLSFDGTNLFVLQSGSVSNQCGYSVLNADMSAVVTPLINFTLSPSFTRFESNHTIHCTGPGQAIVLINASGNPFGPDANSWHPLVSKFIVNTSAVTYTDWNFCNLATVSSKIAFFDNKYWVMLGYRAKSFQNPATNNDNIVWLQQITLNAAQDANTLNNAARVLWSTAQTPLDETTVQTLPPVIEKPTSLPELNVILGEGMITAQRSLSSLGFKTGAQIYATSSVLFTKDDSISTGPINIPDGNYFLSSGSPKIVSAAASEENFLTSPVLFRAVASPTGGFLGNGQYQYYAVWEWVDSLGQIHQSAPSAPVTITVNTGPTSTITLHFSPWLVTSRPGKYSLVFYRTQANQITAYRLTAFDYIYTKDFLRTSAYTSFIIDGTSTATMTDAAIAGNQILYTQGGILPNDPAPNHRFAWLFKNRLFLGGLDEGNTIWYSKTRILGEPIKFSAFFNINVDIAGGPVTAGGTLDDKCIFFKRNKIFYMFGDGPNDAGGGQAFSVPQEVSSPVGCAYPKSVVAMPAGLMFKSEKGIYLLDRGLQVQYIGAPVEAYNQFEVTSAIHLAKFNQVRFSLSNGVVLMFDYLVGQWSVFTNINAVGATIYLDNYTYLRPTGLVLNESTGFLDDTLPITLTIGTPWIKVSNMLQGFQRIKHLLLVGENKSAHTLSVSLGYNYKTNYEQTAQYVPTSSSVLQTRVFAKRGKCEAFRALITDNGTATTGEGFSLSEMAVLIGIKKGLNKVTARQSVS